MPLNTRKRPPSRCIQLVDLAVLLLDVGHAHAARDGQPVRVVGHPHARVAQCHARVRHGLDALAAVAPGRVHLEIAAERRPRHDRSIPRQGERSVPSPAGSESSFAFRASPATLSACLDAATAAATVGDEPDSTSSVTMRALEGPMNGTSRSVPASTSCVTGSGKRDDRFRGALVAELRALVGLQRSHVVQQPRCLHVEIVVEALRLDVPISSLLAASGMWTSPTHLRLCARRFVGKSSKDLACQARSDRALPLLLVKPWGGPADAAAVGVEWCRRTVLVAMAAAVASRDAAEPNSRARPSTRRCARRSLPRRVRRTSRADAEGTKLWKLTRQFYERRKHAPAWIETRQPTAPQMDAADHAR